jgi:GDP-4-dehydro-6-deoxy-D-mannose reductase
LITGITGFAGGYLAEYLLAQGDEVLGTSSSGNWKSDSTDQRERMRLVGWDLASNIPPESFRAIADFAPDCVYHLAAISIPADCGEYEPTPEAVAVNVGGAARVVELCRRFVPQPRLLFVSTSHVYAPVPRENPYVSEDAPVTPTQGYGRTKLMAEQIVLAAVGDHGLPAIVARAFQHAGARQSPRMMLPEWAWQFARGDRPVRIRRPNAYIDLSDVRDVVRAYRLLIEHGAPGAVYNVGSGRCLRSGDVLEELRRIADPGRPIVADSNQVKQDPIARTERLHEATGWQPRLDWRQTVAWIWHDWQRRASQSIPRSTA